MLPCDGFEGISDFGIASAVLSAFGCRLGHRARMPMHPAQCGIHLPVALAAKLPVQSSRGDEIRGPGNCPRSRSALVLSWAPERGGYISTATLGPRLRSGEGGGQWLMAPLCAAYNLYFLIKWWWCAVAQPCVSRGTISPSQVFKQNVDRESEHTAGPTLSCSNH
jgi:hypothetical protein